MYEAEGKSAFAIMTVIQENVTRKVLIRKSMVAAVDSDNAGNSVVFLSGAGHIHVPLPWGKVVKQITGEG